MRSCQRFDSSLGHIIKTRSHLSFYEVVAGFYLFIGVYLYA